MSTHSMNSPTDVPSKAPAIVVVAHDRPVALRRLLSSLGRLRIPLGTNVPLVISVDGSVASTLAVAREAEWPFGDKEVIAHPTRLGLLAHVLMCGDLSERFGSIVMLEDDLYLSPDAYRYAIETMAFYASEEAVAGVSLYSYRLDEYLRLAFHPLDDGYDTFFMQTPSSWGQAWSDSQWHGFQKWLNTTAEVSDDRLPTRAARWPRTSSWKRAFLSYLIDTDKYFVFPSRSLTTNCGDAGQHFGRVTTNLVTPLADGPRHWRFAPWSEGALRYDAWFEPMPTLLKARWPNLVPDDVTVDLRGGKLAEQITTRWLLSSRPCREPSTVFPLLLLPEVLNLGLPNHGTFFHLGQSSSFEAMPAAKRRRLIEAFNGEITHRVALGILKDRVARRLGASGGGVP